VKLQRTVLVVLALVVLALAGVLTAPVAAWTPTSQEGIARAAARLAPPDLHRQIAKNRESYLLGTFDPFNDRQPQNHYQNGVGQEGDGRLAEIIAVAVTNAIDSIRAHRPFNEIVYRMGVVAHYVADANDPLATAESDPEETRYGPDFGRYVESTEPRLRMVFYGFRPGFEGRRDLPALVTEALERSRQRYPLIGREYRRIGLASGVGRFNDRSTAYAVAALGYSHAVSDIAEVLRYIWIEAGGGDSRRQLPTRGRDIVLVPPEPPPR
jgi:hypothetical protein